jgi:hypothetical protein
MCNKEENSWRLLGEECEGVRSFLVVRSDVRLTDGDAWRLGVSGKIVEDTFCTCISVEGKYFVH